MATAIRRRDPRDTPTAIATVLVLLVVDEDNPVELGLVGVLEVDVLAPKLAVWLLVDTDVVEVGNEDLTHGQAYSNEQIYIFKRQSGIQGTSVTHPVCVGPVSVVGVVVADTVGGVLCTGTFALQYPV